MIVDQLFNLSFYTPINRHFATVCRYLESVDLSTMSPGKYAIDGEDVFMTIVETSLRSRDEAPLETHDAYIDIQIVMCGKESFGWRSRSECVLPREAYSEQNDISFYSDLPSGYVDIYSGGMIIFFTHDAHAPLIGQGVVRKCIIKVHNM